VFLAPKQPSFHSSVVLAHDDPYGAEELAAVYNMMPLAINRSKDRRKKVKEAAGSIQKMMATPTSCIWLLKVADSGFLGRLVFPDCTLMANFYFCAG
jgi:hypothetical protein